LITGIGATLSLPPKASTLLRFLREVQTIVAKLQSEGKIHKVMKRYRRPRITRMDYVEGITSMQSTEENIEKEEWDLEGTKLLAIERLDTYADTIRMISESGKTQGDRWLAELTSWAMPKILDGESFDEITDGVVAFLSDLTGGPKECKPILWITGIWLPEERVEVNQGFTLRRPREEDFENAGEQPIEYSHDSFLGLNLEIQVSAIMELKITGVSGMEVQKKLRTIIALLRLFRTGSVEDLRSRLNAKSFEMSFMGTHFRQRSPAIHHKYALRVEDVAQLQRFISTMEHLLPGKIVGSTGNRTDYVGIALQYYFDTLFKFDSVESRLTSAIMCLEALYLGKDEQQELSLRLSQRVAKFLEMTGLNAMEVYNRMKTAYAVRSRYIHGSPSEEEPESLLKLLHHIVEYARSSTVIFLQTQGKIEKDVLLNKISNSLLNRNAQEKLQMIVEGLEVKP